jgi:hypothetical protein
MASVLESRVRSLEGPETAKIAALVDAIGLLESQLGVVNKGAGDGAFRLRASLVRRVGRGSSARSGGF